MSENINLKYSNFTYRTIKYRAIISKYDKYNRYEYYNENKVLWNNIRYYMYSEKIWKIIIKIK